MLKKFKDCYKCVKQSKYGQMLYRPVKFCMKAVIIFYFSVIAWLVSEEIIIASIYAKEWFDSEKWKNYPGECRGHMYIDLSLRHLKKGMHISEVEKMLGEPYSIKYSLDGKFKRAWYPLGNCLYYTFGSRDLDIYYDRDNNIYKYTHFSDKFYYLREWASCNDDQVCICWKSNERGVSRKYICEEKLEKW